MLPPVTPTLSKLAKHKRSSTKLLMHEALSYQSLKAGRDTCTL
jgi:hypothetical protein